MSHWRSGGAGPLGGVTVMLFALLLVLLPASGRASGAQVHERLARVGSWAKLADDPVTADSAWTGLRELLPALSDSMQRGFAWYLMYSAAQSLGRVDSMRVAAESSFVYHPSDPSGLRELAAHLKRTNRRLDWAEDLARRTLTATSASPFGTRDDRRLLGEIQMGRGEMDSAAVSLELALGPRIDPDVAALMDLGYVYARLGRPTLAVERLTRGLSVYPRDSLQAVWGFGLLDSLLISVGGRPDTLHARISDSLEASRRWYYWGSHRDGRFAPRSSLRDLNTGRAMTPGREPGLTVVYAWATWCGPCRSSLPKFEKWIAKPRTRSIRAITVNVEGAPVRVARARVNQFLHASGLHLSVLMADSAAAAPWRFDGIPCVLVLRNGRVEYRGYSGTLEEGLDAELATLGSSVKEH